MCFMMLFFILDSKISPAIPIKIGTPLSAKKIAISFPPAECGTISQYPIVVIVITAKYTAFGKLRPSM